MGFPTSFELNRQLYPSTHLPNENVQAPASKPRPSRPLGVTIIAIIAMAGGVLSLLGGVSVLAGMGTGPFALAITVLVFGFLGIGLGGGLLLGKHWARMSTIVVYLFSVALGIAEIAYGGTVGGTGGIIRIVAGVIIPVYLTRPRAKTFFG